MATRTKSSKEISERKTTKTPALFEVAGEAEETQMYLGTCSQLLADLIGGDDIKEDGDHLSIALKVTLEKVLKRNQALTDLLYDLHRRGVAL